MCDKCKKHQIAAALALAGAFQAIGVNVSLPDAGALGEEIALGVGEGYKILEWDGSHSKPEQHEKAEAEGSRLVVAAMDKFDSRTVGEVEHMTHYFESAIETIQIACRKTLITRYKAGDRSMDEFHLSKLEQAANAEKLIDVIAEALGIDPENVQINEVEVDLARDTSGNPIMAPVDNVS